MRLALLSLALMTTSLSGAFAANLEAPSKIDAVTVFPQGAEVTRVANVKVPAGAHTLLLEGLPAEADPQSIRVEGSAGGSIEITSVDSRQVPLAGAAQDADRKRIEAQIEALQDERSALDQTLADADYQKRLLMALADKQLTPAPNPDKPLMIDGAGIDSVLDAVGRRLEAVSRSIHAAQLRQRAIDRQVSDLQAELAVAAPEQGSKLQVAVNVSAAAESEGSFRVRYRVASAGWSPFYDARLVTTEKGKSGKVEIVRRADVMQSTGEEWKDVTLTLSTARTLGATEAPFMAETEVQAYDDQPRLEGDVKLKSEGSGAASNMAELPAAAPVEELADKPRPGMLQRQAQVELAGFQAQYMIAGRESVDNSGTSKKVRIATDQFDGELQAFTVPKLDPQAYLTAKFKSASAAPFLPGTVNLYRDGIYLGQGALPLVTEGQEVALGFGADDMVQVTRTEVRRQSGEEGLISTSNMRVQSWDIEVKNLHDFVLPVTVLDQMPFSTNDKVTIEMLPLGTEPTEKDYEKRRGVMAWQMSLDPKSAKQINFGYKMLWPKDLRLSQVE